METEEIIEQPGAGGAPTKYRAAYAKQANKLCLLGATTREIADFFEVSESTVYLWAKEHKKFSEALKGGRLKADAEVASSLYRRATGYSYKEITFEKIGSQDLLESTSEGDILKDTYRKKIVLKDLAPDVGAATMWLKNRSRDKWRDKFDLGVDFAKMDDGQVSELYERILSGIKSIHDPDNTGDRANIPSE